VDGLRRLRTSFGDSIDSKNRTVKEAAKTLWPTLSRDIDSGLRSNGLTDAARAYRAADRNYATRSQNLDSIGLILGDGQHSADIVADNISKMSRTDYGQLSRAIGVLPADQQNSIRGAIVESLGRALPSKQDGTGARFSLETFLTQWSHDKFSAQAKAAILPAQTIRDLNDLATLASANRALRSKGNSSRSGVTVGNLTEFAAAPAIFSNPAAFSAALTAFGGGKLLATPGVARALVRASESRSIEVLSRRLSEVARRNPAAAQAILGFRDAMVSGKLRPLILRRSPIPSTSLTGRRAKYSHENCNLLYQNAPSGELHVGGHHTCRNVGCGHLCAMVLRAMRCRDYRCDCAYQRRRP
jgi:hypothetical protein